MTHQSYGVVSAAAGQRCGICCRRILLDLTVRGGATLANLAAGDLHPSLPPAADFTEIHAFQVLCNVPPAFRLAQHRCHVTVCSRNAIRALPVVQIIDTKHASASAQDRQQSTVLTTSKSVQALQQHAAHESLGTAAPR